MKPHETVIWQSGRPVVARFGVFGDFLPWFEGADPEDWVGPARALRPLLEDVEFSAANLELPLGVEGLPPVPKAGLGANIHASASACEYLSEARTSVLGLANNHIYDFGSAGVDRTRRVLDRAGLACLGAGRTLGDEPEVHVQGCGSGRVGVWAAANNTLDQATRRRPGVEDASPERAAAAVASLRRLGATCSVALIHAGMEHTNHPDPADVGLLDELAEAGFDIVAACHSHRIAGVSKTGGASRRPSFCFHGLGSVVSGVIYGDKEREGGMVVAGLDDDGALADLRWRPLVLEGSGWGCGPRPDRAQQLIDDFLVYSRALADGSYASAYYDDMSNGLLTQQWADVRVAFRNGGVRGVVRKAARLRGRHIRRLAHRVLPFRRDAF